MITTLITGRENCFSWMFVYCRVIAICMFVVADSFAQQIEKQYEFNIQEETLAGVLDAVVQQTGVLVLYPSELASETGMNPVTGRYSVNEALEIVLHDTGFVGGLTERGVITISRAPLSENEGGQMTTVKNPKRSILAGIAALFAVASDPSQSADETENDAEGNPEHTLEEIIVTGSWIRGGNASDNLITIDREAIDKAGFSDIDGLLRALPQNYASDSPAAARGTSGALNSGFGSGVNLRGLGSDSTLTLLNGRRIAPAGGDVGGFTDVGGLPLAAIERVEVLLDGASALYGSDAVGGVVNFVLRSDYDGAETRLRYGSGSTEADDYTLSQVVGHSWQSGRMLASVEYRETDPVAYSEFGITSLDLRPLGGDDFRPSAFDLASGSFNPGAGTVLPTGAFLTDLLAPFATIPQNQDGTALTLADVNAVFDPTALPQTDPVPLQVTPEIKQLSTFISLEQNLFGSVELFSEIMYAARENAVEATRTPLDFIVVSPLNAFTPFTEPVVVVYDPTTELGPARVEADTETFFINLGLEGELGGNWTWDIAGTYSEDESNSGVFNEFMKNPLQVSQFVDNPDPAVAFNPFGDGTAQNPETIASLTDFTIFDQYSDLWSFQSKISGVLAALPGGDLAIAFGGEYREESLADYVSLGSVDPLLPSPVSFFDPVAVERDLWAVFGEASIPLVSEANAKSGVHSLELSVAGRFEDYSDFGTSFNPKFGIAWFPVEPLLIRANWSTSFRAPLLRELFGTSLDQPGFPVFDPNAPGGPALVLARLRDGGNPALMEESGEIFNVGFEFRPATAGDLLVSLTCFQTDFDDRIRGGFDGLTLDLLLANEDRLPPGLIIRDAAGNLTTISTANINAAGTEIAGLDFAVNYSVNTDSGAFGASLSGTYFTKFEEQLFDGDQALDLLNTIGSPVDLRMRGVLNWTRGNLSASLSANYTDGYVNSLQDAAGVPQNQQISSYTTVDLQFAHEPRFAGALNDTTIRLGATNLFEADVPFVNSSDRLGLDVERIETRGRVIYLELTKSFNW